MVEGKQLKAWFLAKCEPESLEPQASREGKPAYLDRWHRLKTKVVKSPGGEISSTGCFRGNHPACSPGALSDPSLTREEFGIE